MPNPISNRLLLRNAEIKYLLDDEFNTNLAAGSVNGTNAEPGPGTRRVTDTGNLLALTRGRTRLSSLPAANWLDPDLYYTPNGMIRAASFYWIDSGGVTDGPAMLISPTDRPADPTITGLGIYAGVIHRLYGIPSKLQITKPEYIYNLPYLVYIIRRPSGGAWFILSSSDANYGDNCLLWVEDTDDITTATFLGLDAKVSPLDFEYVRAITANRLEPRFLTDYGVCISADTFTRADSTNIGATEIGAQTWVEFENGMAISGNKLIASANQAGAIVNLGQQPRIIDCDVVVPAGGGVNVRMYFRSGNTGAFNNTLAYVVSAASGALYVNGASVQSAAGGALIAGQTNRVRVVDFGTHVRCYTNGLICINYADATNVDVNHYYAGMYVWTGAVGYGIDNWRVYPATVVAPALLGTVPAIPAGSGAAIFSDDMTDDDATELHAHNAAWTVEPTGNAFEINTNAARMTADGVTGYAVVDAGTPDHEIACNMHTPNTEPGADNVEWFCGLVARWTDTDNYLIARWIYSSSGEIELREKVDGADLLIGMVSNINPTLLAKNTTYAIKLIVNGDDVCVYHGTKLLIRIKTILLTGTKCGIAAEAIGGVGNRPTWDDVVVKAVV